ncbi:MAG: signal recognition particle-docking protein FtsY [Desulfobulbaceae bacterium]|uniref:Signal recognition particle receptor FtsY n=1 Tax=Candidatus Desulfatifera sulfidica TaxID=2841691 RepID=A0A8J6TA52_9BACT|nr:signal recognition particle-docking protein FtsY [Candidatus Desulfatifera sulfidica]
MLGWFKKKFTKTPTPPPEEILEDGPVVEEETPLAPESLPEAQASAETTTETLLKEITDPAPEPEETEATVIAEPVPEPEPEPTPITAQPEVENKIVAKALPEQEVNAEDQAPPQTAEKKTSSMFQRLSQRLAKTRDSFVHQLDTLFLGKKIIDDDLLDELEEILITADIGINTTLELLDDARRRVKRKELSDPQSLKKILKEKIQAHILDSNQPAELVMPQQGPFVIMVIGVNGVGKTTTIGKITRKFKLAGQSVLLVAADTFRAAAVSQLKIWGERNQVPVIAHKEGADPSSVVYDALDDAHKYDVVIVDTAGRLHTQTNLMEELKKIKRVMNKKMPGAPHEILLVLDATTGQNAISQAKLFNEAVTITGLALTKLDGTAKGGIIVNICRELKIPVRFIGIGEKVEDLRDFDAGEFVDALFQETTN